MKTKFQHKGFTLIEILVAMTILFLVVTTGFMAFQTALSASQRAIQLQYLLTALPYVQQELKFTLLDSPELTNGTGMQLGVSYFWENQPGALKGAPDDPYALSIGEPPNKLRFRLHTIKVTLSYEQQQREFTYQELTWLP